MDEFKAPEFATMMYIEDVVGVPGFSLGEVKRRKMLDILIGGTMGSKKGSYLGIKKIKACE